jgi:hypothetical protein
MPTSLRQSQSRTKQNKISSVPTKSPTSTCQVAGSNLAFTRWTTKPQRMLKFIQFQQTTLQYTPPDIHCTNSAKQAICTWKNYFTAGTASLPKSFPIANRCCLTNQCDYTINMLHPCRQNSLLSAFEAMEGSYIFDATPIAPPGTKVLVHLKLTRHRSWNFHASNRWYVGPSLNH